MKCFRFELKDALYARFQEYLSIKSWPYPPDLFSIPYDELSRTVVVVLSIDSGTGMLKMMMRFLTKTSSQSPNDVTLLSEAHVAIESFQT